MRELFLVCPFSDAEAYVRENINPEGYFMTSAGSVFRFNSPDYIESIVEFIQRCEIEQIYCVSSPDCMFVKKVIEGSSTDNFYAERDLAQLRNQSSRRFIGLNQFEQMHLLANLQIQKQAEGLQQLLTTFNIDVPVTPLLIKNRLAKKNLPFHQQSSRL